MSLRLENDHQFEQLYRDYIAAINTIATPDSDALRPYLASTVIHNDTPLDLKGYTALIDPTSEFHVLGLVVNLEQGMMAARLKILFPGVGPVMEHVFYAWDREKKVITRVWSMVKWPDRESEGEK